MLEDGIAYGPVRTELARLVAKKLSRYGFIWFLDGGTLLGAYRSGRMIAHDDDFDIGVLGTPDMIKMMAPLFHHKISYSGELAEARLVNSYCHKVEVYLPSYGKHQLDKDHDYHNVSIDLQLYTIRDKKTSKLISYHDASKGDAVRLEYYRDDLYKFINLTVDDLLPLTTIIYDEYGWKSPHRVKSFLSAAYGFLGQPARYNPTTRKYEPIDK